MAVVCLLLGGLGLDKFHGGVADTSPSATSYMQVNLGCCFFSFIGVWVLCDP